MARIESRLPIHGWINLDKPKGLTSSQALGKVKKIIGCQKAGYAGTLDPMATGVLPIAFGEATKLVSYVVDGAKEYEFSIRWGEERSTDDMEGEVVAESNVRPSEKEIIVALPRFVGKIEQIPPSFSALKIGGERAYDIARSGFKPDLVRRQVIIYAFDLLSLVDSNNARFRTVCGKGMYVRALARDFARFLGTYGHVRDLRRTRVGIFTAANTISLEKLEEIKHKEGVANVLLDLKAALDDIPALSLTSSEATQLRNGQSLLIRPQNVQLMQEKVILAEHKGVPVALVEPRKGAFFTVRGFRF